MQWHYTLQKKNLGNMLCLGKCSNEIASTSARILGIINSIFILFFYSLVEVYFKHTVFRGISGIKTLTVLKRIHSYLYLQLPIYIQIFHISINVLLDKLTKS